MTKRSSDGLGMQADEYYRESYEHTKMKRPRHISSDHNAVEHEQQLCAETPRSQEHKKTAARIDSTSSHTGKMILNHELPGPDRQKIAEQKKVDAGDAMEIEEDEESSSLFADYCFYLEDEHLPPLKQPQSSQGTNWTMIRTMSPERQAFRSARKEVLGILRKQSYE